MDLWLGIYNPLWCINISLANRRLFFEGEQIRFVLESCIYFWQMSDDAAPSLEHNNYLDRGRSLVCGNLSLMK